MLKALLAVLRSVVGGMLVGATSTCLAQGTIDADRSDAARPSEGDLKSVRRVLERQPVGNTTLDSMRGGFDDGRGLRASFGIERTISIDGVTVTLQSVHIADLSRVNAEQAQRLVALLGSATLIQNGAGNSLLAGQSQLRAGVTVIQNSLDNQSIKSSTLIDSASNSLRLLQGINANSSLRDALLAPLAARP